MKSVAVTFAAVFLIAIAGVAPAGVGSAAAAADVGYRGPSFAGASAGVTGEKPESKLWWNDDSWWGSIWSTSANRYDIYRLDRVNKVWVDTGVALDTRPSSRADTLWDQASGKLYVVSHPFTKNGSGTSIGAGGKIWRFHYTGSTYVLDSGFPKNVNAAKTETLVFEKDSTGRLWTTWVQKDGTVYKVFVAASDDDGATWGAPFVLPVTGSTVSSDDIASVVAMGDRVGILWSNQSTPAMYWSEHLDSDPATTWQPTKIAYGGSHNADDHINLKSLQSGGSTRVFAAVKTSQTSSSSPILLLLDYNLQTGVWGSHVFSTVADGGTRPIVLVDTANQKVHMLATFPEGGGIIYRKTVPWSNLTFAPGKGDPFILDGGSSDLNNVTSTKQNVDATTGLVAMASNDATHYYWWNEDPLVTGPQPLKADFTGTPTSGQAPLTVNFSDASTGAVTSRSWDFDNDGTVDSTATNPSHTYTDPGTYTVKLTVGDGSTTDSATKTNYITVTAPPPPGSTVTFTATDDAQVRVALPTSNFGSSTELRIRSDGGVNDYQSYVKFSVSGVSGAITSAKLRLFVTDPSNVGGRLYQTGTSWSESTITWNNKPAFGSQLGSAGPTTLGTWVEFDVSSAVTANGTYAFGLDSTSTDSQVYSSRQGANAPQLVVTTGP
jgi:PKD repeat protein